jgi:hypothetical protein
MMAKVNDMTDPFARYGPHVNRIMSTALDRDDALAPPGASALEGSALHRGRECRLGLLCRRRLRRILALVLGRWRGPASVFGRLWRRRRGRLGVVG